MEGDAQIVGVSAQTKLKRFLLYASDSNIYMPGCRLQKKFYDIENIEKLRNILNQLEKQIVLTMIKWISDQKSSPHPEVIPLVLSECCRKPEWRKDALAMTYAIIRDPDQFLLFFKFGFEIKPKLGTGRAIKRLIRDWYDREESLDIASFIGERPRYHGWSHADLIKLAHIKTKNTAKMAVYAYAIRGKEKMTEQFGEDPAAKKIVNHFVKIDDFKHCDNPSEVVRTIEEYILSIPYCNHVNLKHKKVWKALIPKMTVNEIVPRLHLISKYGLFRSPDLKSWDTQFNPILFDRLVNKHNILKSKIQPSPVCLELYRYQNEPSLKYAAALKNKTKTKKAPQIYSEYVTALEQVMQMAMENIKKTDLNYTLIIDNYKLRSRKCAYRRFFSPHVAAALLALCLEKAGASVKIVSFDGKTNQTHNGSTFQTLTSVLGNDSSTKPFTRMMVNYCSPSNKHNSETDVYVFLANTIKYAKFLDVIKQHRLKNPKNPRFIFCSLCGLKYTGEIEEAENAIVTSGFNDRLFYLINSFGKKIPILES